MIYKILWKFLVIFTVVLRGNQAASRSSHDPIKVYDYHGTINAGDSRYLDDVSQFTISAKLVVIEKNFATVFQLTKIKIGSYYGNLSYRSIPETKFVPLEQPIHLAFAAKKNRFGMFDQTIFMKNDPQWMRNVKKGIASLLNVPQFSRDELEQRVFEREENDIFGDCTSSYVIDDKNETTYRLLKVQNYEDDPDSKYFDYIENRNRSFCNRNITENEKYHHERSFEYWFRKQGDKFKIVSVNVESLLKVPIARNTKIFQYFRTVQKLGEPDPDFSDFTVDFRESDFEIHESISFNLLRRNSSPGNLKAMLMPSFGVLQLGKEAVRDAIVLLKNTSLMYNNIQDGLNFGLISSVQLDKLLWYFKNFKSDQLSEIYDAIKRSDGNRDEKIIFQFFIELIGQTGTDESARYVIKLLHKDEETGKKVLPKLAINWVDPTDHVLAYVVNELIKKNDPTFLQSASIILGHTNTYYKNYTDIILQKLKSSRSLDRQFVNFFALCNIFSEYVFDKILPIAMGRKNFLEITFGHHLQVHGIRAIGRISREHPDKNAVQEMMSLVTNNNLHLDIRIAALEVIFDTGSKTDLQQLSNYMKIQRIKNLHLYNFYYQTLYYAAKNDHLCNPNIEFHDFAKDEMLYLNNEPEATTTTFFQIETGGESAKNLIDIGLVADENTNEVNQVNLRMASTNGEFVSSDHEIYIKFEGAEDLFQYLLKSRIPYAEMLHKLLEELPTRNRHSSSEKIFEFTYFLDGKQISHIFLNGTKGWNTNVWRIFLDTELPKIWNLILKSTYEELIVPIDFGLYVQAVHSSPQGLLWDWNDWKFDYRYWFRGFQTLKMFNPFLDATMGTTELLALHSEIALGLALNVTTKNVTLEMEILKDRNAGFVFENHLLMYILPENAFKDHRHKIDEFYHKIEVNHDHHHNQNFMSKHTTKNLTFNCDSDKLMTVSEMGPVFPLNCQIRFLQKANQINPIKMIYQYGLKTQINRPLRNSSNTFNSIIQNHYLDMTTGKTNDRSSHSSKESRTRLFELHLNQTENKLLNSINGFMGSMCFNYSKSFENEKIIGNFQVRQGQTSQQCFRNRETLGRISWTAYSRDRDISHHKECKPHNAWLEEDKHRLTLECILAWTRIDTYEYEVDWSDNVTHYLPTEKLLKNVLLEGFVREREVLEKIDPRSRNQNTNMTIKIDLDLIPAKAEIKQNNRLTTFSKTKPEDFSLFGDPDTSPHMGLLWNIMKDYGLLKNYVVVPNMKEIGHFTTVTYRTEPKIFEASEEFQIYLTNGNNLKMYWRLKAKKDEYDEMVLKIDFGTKGYITISPSRRKKNDTAAVSIRDMDRQVSNYIADQGSDPNKYYGLTIADIKDKTVVFLPKLSAIIIYDKYAVQVLIADYFANFLGVFVE